jgi:hypothetical protein
MSTTLRFGLACLKAFEYVRKWAKEEMAAQADLLHEIAASINNRDVFFPSLISS